MVNHCEGDVGFGCRSRKAQNVMNLVKGSVSCADIECVLVCIPASLQSIGPPKPVRANLFALALEDACPDLKLGHLFEASADRCRRADRIGAPTMDVHRSKC